MDRNKNLTPEQIFEMDKQVYGEEPNTVTFKPWQHRGWRYQHQMDKQKEWNVSGDLMDIARQAGYPEVKLLQGVTIGAGEDNWHKFCAWTNAHRFDEARELLKIMLSETKAE